MVFGFGRIEFDGNFINLNRPWTSFQPFKPVSRNVNESRDGSEEINKFFSQWFINAQLNLLDPQEKAQLQRLFEYAEDGSSFTLIRDRNLGTYINFEGGINPTVAPRGLKTIDDTDGTFTRINIADSAWYLDEGTGLMTLRDGADVPRFPEGKYGAGIQIDGAAINLVTNRISNAAWIKSGITAVTTTETLDPAGGSNADKLTATSPNGDAFFSTGTPKGNNARVGIWLKSSSGNVSAKLKLQGTTSGEKNLDINVTPVWQRFDTGENTVAYVGNLRIRILIVTNGDIIYSWHTPQLFDNALFDLGTVGALSTSSITRNTELLKFLSANIVNRDKGTIIMWVKPGWDSLGAGINAMFYEGGDSVGAQANVHIRFLFVGSSNRMQLQIKGDNIDLNRIDYTTSVNTGLTQNNYHQVGFTYDTTIANGGHIYIDGVESSSGSVNSAFNVSETGDTFAIGSELDGQTPSFCEIDEVLIMKEILSSSEIAGIFDLGIGLGVQKNRWTVKMVDPTFDARWLSSDIYDIPISMKEALT